MRRHMWSHAPDDSTPHAHVFSHVSTRASFLPRLNMRCTRHSQGQDTVAAKAVTSPVMVASPSAHKHHPGNLSSLTPPRGQGVHRWALWYNFPRDCAATWMSLPSLAVSPIDLAAGTVSREVVSRQLLCSSLHDWNSVSTLWNRCTT